MSTGLPLRDRIQSVSPDDNNGWLPRPTTPLRIAKRESASPQPQAAPLSRRQSASYKHLKSNHLVSKSPFRSQIPTPAKPPLSPATPRRVSGEKRPRPPSMVASAENEHPLGFKRRQSKGFQGLLQKEPVTKSPFKKAPGSEAVVDDEGPPPVPPKLSRVPAPSASPGRSSLVSKRLHGPRNVSSGSLRRQRRKTVTFDERCDVVEFDVEEDELNSDVFDSESDEGEEEGDHDHHDNDVPEQPPTVDDTYDIAQAGDDSITGLVDSMLHDSSPSTPPRSRHLPPDTETEDGVPYGRTHHAARLSAVYHHSSPVSVSEHGALTPASEEETEGPPDLTVARDEQSDAHRALSPPVIERRSASPLELLPPDPLSTPPHSRAGTPVIALSPGSHIPLGRSTHSERAKAQREQHAVGELDEDVCMLPPSPSPAKRVSTAPRVSANIESLIPRFDLGVVSTPSGELVKDDPFALPRIKDEPVPVELSFMSGDSGRDDSMDPSNLSIGHSEVSLDGLDREVDGEDDAQPQAQAHTDNSALLSGPRTLAPGSLPLPPSIAKAEPSSSRPSTPLDRSTSSIASTGSGFRFTSPGQPPRSNSPRSSLLDEVAMPRAVRPFASPVTTRVGSPLRHSVSSEDVSRWEEEAGDMEVDAEMPTDVVDKPSCLLADGGPGFEDGTGRAAADEDGEAKHTEDDEDDTQDDRTESDHGTVPPPMSRHKNATHDGVLALDPEPQPIDPPRPSMLMRANTEDVEREYTFEGLHLDFEDSFALGGSKGSARRGDLHLGDVSALDRLMENVAHSVGGSGSDEMTLAEIAPHLTHHRIGSDPSARSQRTMSESSAIPAPPPKDAIRARDELIKAKKREARQKEEQEALGIGYSSAQLLKVGRPMRRRSMSTGDAEDMLAQRSGAAQRRGAALRQGGLLDVLPIEDENDPLSDSINRELLKLEGPSKSKYHVRERRETIYASSDANGDSHHAAASDTQSGKAWKTVKRPSDMNEYAKQLKELRAQDKSGKAHGKVFVRVIGLKSLDLPMPQQPTTIACTLNNGIHYVTTPECRLGRECRIDQEFELIEHSKLEFTLTIKVRRDPHIIAQFKANAPPLPPPAPAPVQVAPPPPSKGGGMRNFFRSSSPAKKAPKALPAPKTAMHQPPVHRVSENLARYLKPDGTLARAFISFRDIAPRCDTKLFETSYPLIGQRLETGGTMKSMQVGDIVLQIFRLPPLPGIPPEQLPQSLEECHRGLRHTAWHKNTYFEGTLTQNGGDCMSWRRRHLRLVGANLIAYNDVTKRAIATIDLKKAVTVEDDQDVRSSMLSPASGVSSRSRHVDEFDGPYGSERSFRLVFPQNQEITFFADTDEEKARWLEVLRALVGRIPPNPLWAELVWQRQQELGREDDTRLASPQLHR